MKLETFFKHFDLLAEAPNAVQKLRELILDLAVRGKLVLQDENDEPAAVFLERIKKEKERFVKDGTNKQSKPLPKITPDEITYKIPQKWEWIRIGQIALIQGGKRLPKGASFSIQPTSHIYIQVTNMKNGTIIDNGLKYIDDNVYQPIKKYIIERDDLYITIAGTIGQVGEVPEFFNKMNLTENAAKIVFQGLNKKYFLLVLSSNIAQQQFKDKTNQQAQPKLAIKRIADAIIPIPPLNEQKRIVTKVDELMKLCDELEARQKKKRETRILINNAALNKLLTADTPETFTKNWQRISDNFDILYSAPENIGKLRQAILQLAVMGKLVPQNANDEPAAVLLERIKKEKERLVKEGKIKKEKSLPAIKDDEIPFDLPIGWEWVRLGELAKVIEYGTSEKSSELRDDVPVFRMNNVQEGKIIFENLKYVSATIKDLPRLYLQHGDLLFNRTNSYELVGKTGVFKGISNQYTFASYLIKISLMLEYISPDFINTAINSAYFRQTQINPEITQQCGQANFNGTKLKNTLIPLPPLAEQKRIVTKVDKLMKLCDELETKLTQTQTEREKIINAAVKQLLTV
ncbi:MAG: restriction endonuclease subunit S [Aphanizomenon sp.]|jgi:type I restriction enzyme S subunit